MRRIATHSVLPSASRRSHHFRLPNRGVREQPKVPDRLKDAMAYMSADAAGQNINFDGQKSGNLDQTAKSSMMTSVFSERDHMKTSNKLDRVRLKLEELTRQSKTTNPQTQWEELFIHLRSAELCTELIEDRRIDEPKKGSKLWVELEYCEYGRVPYVVKLPNGIFAVPIFTAEVEMDHYFLTQDVWESCTIPHPRCGEQGEVYGNKPQPVTAIGTLRRMASLSTMASKVNQLPIIINPTHKATKIVTYPEMVAVAKSKRFEKGGSGTVPEEFKIVLDTRNVQFERLHPSQIPTATVPGSSTALPMIARVELQMLLYRLPQIKRAYIAKKDASLWKRTVSGKETITELSLLVDGEVDREEAERLVRLWSFLSEFSSDLVVTFVDSKEGEKVEGTLLYKTEDCDWYRDAICKPKASLVETLDYDEKLEW